MDNPPDVKPGSDPSDQSAAPTTGESWTADSDLSNLLEDWLASPAETRAAPGSASPQAAPAQPSPVSDARAPAAPADALDRAASLLEALTADPGDLPEDASAAAAAAEPGERDHFVLFRAGGATYAVREMLVTEIGTVPGITIVPHVPAWVRGVTSLRGDILSVIDLRVLLGLDCTSPHTGRLLVVRLVDEEFALGILVDGVDQIATLTLDDVRATASPLEGALAPYVTGVCHLNERLIAVLDLDRLLRSAEIRQFNERRDAEPGA